MFTFEKYRNFHQEAKQTTATPFGPGRAAEIEAAARAATQYGPYSDRMWEQMTPGEYGYVLQVWDVMPGNTCWMDAFHRIANGKVP
jgi:hypothetical protein